MKRCNLQEISGFTIHVGKHEYWRYEDLIKSNTPLSPEVVGLLLGRAQVAWVDVTCEFCKKPIVEGDEWKNDDLRPTRVRWAHQRCVSEVEASC